MPSPAYLIPVTSIIGRVHRAAHRSVIIITHQGPLSYAIVQSEGEPAARSLSCILTQARKDDSRSSVVRAPAQRIAYYMYRYVFLLVRMTFVRFQG